MMPPRFMKTLNIIGAGRVGRTLAALWQQQGVFVIQDVLNRALESARAAGAFIGKLIEQCLEVRSHQNVGDYFGRRRLLRRAR